jgi:hypothetical protein
MLVQITVQVDGREVRVCKTLAGTPAEREEGVQGLLREVGRGIAEAALNEAAAQTQHPCCCGRPMENRGSRVRTLQGLQGALRIRRTRYRCRTCQRECTPADGLLECGRHRLTRPLAKRVCQLATVEHFTRLPQLVFDQHGVSLSHHEILDLVHDVGGAVDSQRRAEVATWAASADKHWPAAEVTPRRVYVSCDGIMYCTNQREPDPQQPDQQRLVWQQMRVGCVYWQDDQERWHKQMIWGREDAPDFGASLFRLACRCGYREAQERLFAADGGEWCWSIQQAYFAAAQGILDWYHASEHVWDTARALHPHQDTAARHWAEAALARLHDQGGCALLDWLLAERARWRGRKRQRLQQLINYVQPRLDRTNYPAYRARGWQIGSGMIESTAKQLVALRLKGPGMHWSEAGALAVTALRATDLNGRWHKLWNNLILNA